VSTDDRQGCIRAYVGEGQFTDDPLNTFGTRAVVQVPQLQALMQFVCRTGFEHHAAMNASHCAGILAEAMDTYLGWDVHRHSSARTRGYGVVWRFPTERWSALAASRCACTVG
jgi:L-fucose isomerase-like protein